MLLSSFHFLSTLLIESVSSAADSILSLSFFFFNFFNGLIDCFPINLLKTHTTYCSSSLASVKFVSTRLLPSFNVINLIRQLLIVFSELNLILKYAQILSV